MSRWAVPEANTAAHSAERHRMSTLVLDAEALYRELLRGVQKLRTPDTRLVGITSGGAWLAERLHKDLGLAGTGRRHLLGHASR